MFTWNRHGFNTNQLFSSVKTSFSWHPEGGSLKDYAELLIIFIRLVMLLHVPICYCPILQTIATASTFLACKIGDSPRFLKDVVLLSYEMMYEWDPLAAQRIRKEHVSWDSDASLWPYLTWSLFLIYQYMHAETVR